MKRAVRRGQLKKKAYDDNMNLYQDKISVALESLQEGTTQYQILDAILMVIANIDNKQVLKEAVENGAIK